MVSETDDTCGYDIVVTEIDDQEPMYIEVKTTEGNWDTPFFMSENEVGGIDSSRLNSLIERIERLEEEKKGIASDIRDIYAEAKGVGFDVKIMRTIIKLRKMNQADRDEQEFLLETYRKALNV